MRFSIMGQALWSPGFGSVEAFFSGVAAFLETGDLAATTPLLRSPRGDRGGAAGEKAFAAAAAAATSW